CPMRPDLQRAVYPRWRGEHGLQTSIKRRQAGLSPLARGTRQRRRLGRRFCRFIPAGAGNTMQFP
ncbi:hypothetical protein, partial [Salmonella enterica subsp. enterica serovar Bredeney]